jgi:hypothetical protein
MRSSYCPSNCVYRWRGAYSGWNTTYHCSMFNTKLSTDGLEPLRCAGCLETYRMTSEGRLVSGRKAVAADPPLVPTLCLDLGDET